MGVVVSNQAHQVSLFVDQELDQSYPIFMGKNNSMDEFVKYIKDGAWIDDLSISPYFSTRQFSSKMKSYTVTFYSIGMFSFLTGGDRKLSHSNSVRTSSVSTRDSYQPSVEHFSEFYVNVEEKTCFKSDEMMAFLVSIVYPFYIQSGSRKAMHTLDYTGSFEDDYVTHGDPSNDDVDVSQLQELLLSTAAFFDDADLYKTLSSREWMATLSRAINDCTLEVCICAVDSAHTFPPILINSAARKRTSLLNKSSKARELDFLQLWSIEHEETVCTEIMHSLASAEPMRLTGYQLFPDRTKTVVDVTHVFDEHGAHRYVLGVQMNIPQEGKSPEHLSYLHNTCLLIAHLIKTSAPPTPAEHSSI